MIAIVDYGVGNVLAIRNVYGRVDVPVTLARSPDDLAGASKLILPGVGAFDNVMTQFNASSMRATVETMVKQDRIPVLGICVGMQILADSSDEGSQPGLGWIPGKVRKFRDPHVAVPHMGWNEAVPGGYSGLFAGFERDPLFYFLHTFFFEASADADVLATSQYGGRFSCAVQRGNVFGVQFHPEKSHHWGERLLKNFAGI